MPGQLPDLVPGDLVAASKATVLWTRTGPGREVALGYLVRGDLLFVICEEAVACHELNREVLVLDARLGCVGWVMVCCLEELPR